MIFFFFLLIFEFLLLKFLLLKFSKKIFFKTKKKDLLRLIQIRKLWLQRKQMLILHVQIDFPNSKSNKLQAKSIIIENIPKRKKPLESYPIKPFCLFIFLFYFCSCLFLFLFYFISVHVCFFFNSFFIYFYICLYLFIFAYL